MQISTTSTTILIVFDTAGTREHNGLLGKASGLCQNMLELYHHGSSVCAAKVRLALAEKGLEWQGHYIDILKGDQFDPAYIKLNPKAVVPTLVHDGLVLQELTVICEYIDEVFPDSPLKPDDAASRARMRLWTKAIDEILHPMCGEITFACSHRHTVARLGPEGLANFLASTPPISVTAGWHERKKVIVREGLEAPESTGRCASMTAICKRWRTRSVKTPGSRALRIR